MTHATITPAYNLFMRVLKDAEESPTPQNINTLQSAVNLLESFEPVACVCCGEIDEFAPKGQLYMCSDCAFVCVSDHAYACEYCSAVVLEDTSREELKTIHGRLIIPHLKDYVHNTQECSAP